MNNSKRYTVLDLFCGAGGMAEGFIQAGFNIVAASDYSKEASETYINRHSQLGYNPLFYMGDIKDLCDGNILQELIGENKIDVVTGGPPCQGFSSVGKRAQSDERNALFLYLLKIVSLVNPSYFIMENVAGILTFKFKELVGISGKKYVNTSVPEIIKAESLYIGYKVDYKVLNAKEFGVPQNRPRVIFIGHRIRNKGNTIVDLVIPAQFPRYFQKMVNVREAISDLRFLKNNEVCQQYNNRFKRTWYQQMLIDGLTPSASGKSMRAISLLNHKAANHSEKTIERFKLLRPGEEIDELLKRLNIGASDHYHTKKFRCQRLRADSISPTILTLPDDIIHYDSKNPRILTVREHARLQSFDDSFEFLGPRTTGGSRRKWVTPQFTQVGNAVPPLFARAIAEELIVALEKTNGLKCVGIT